MTPKVLLPLHSLDWGFRVQYLLLFFVLSSFWLQYAVKRIAPGAYRFISVCPLLVLNSIAPLLFHETDEFLTRTVVAFASSWLMQFKLLSLIMGRGPLRHQWTFGQLAALYLLPLYPSEGAVLIGGSK